MVRSICGPYKLVITAQIKNLTNFPTKIALKNQSGFISNTPAASSNSFTGIGGGIIAGIMIAINSCFSKRSRNCSYRFRLIRFSRNNSPPPPPPAKKKQHPHPPPPPPPQPKTPKPPHHTPPPTL